MVSTLHGSFKSPLKKWILIKVLSAGDRSCPVCLPLQRSGTCVSVAVRVVELEVARFISDQYAAEREKRVLASRRGPPTIKTDEVTELRGTLSVFTVCLETR